MGGALNSENTQNSRKDGFTDEEDPVRNRQKTHQVCDWLAFKQTASPLGEEALALCMDGSLR